MLDAAPPTRPEARVRRWEVGVVAVWFAVFVALAAQFPRSGDDWGWQVEGIDRLHVFFAGYNGRYAGDLLMLGLTHAGRPVAAIAVALIISGTLVLALHLAGNRTPLGYGLATVLFFTMPLGVWRQGVAWLSGLVNYATAALALLAFLAVAQSEWQGRTRRPVAWKLALTGLGAFIGQLFMEHVTLCICALAVLVCAAHRRQRRRWPAYTLSWAVGGIIGAVAMFSNSAYRHAAAGTGYQRLGGRGHSALHDLAVKALDTIPTNAVVLNVVLNVVLSVSTVMLVMVGPWRRARTARALLVVTPLFLGLTVALWLSERHTPRSEHIRALAAVAAVLLVVVLLLLWRTLNGFTTSAVSFLMATLSFVLLQLPLAVVNPVGPRCFYPSYLILTTVVITLVREVREQRPILASPFVPAALHVASAGLAVMMLIIYGDIQSAMRDRLAQVRAADAAGSNQVTIAPLPHSYYVHDANPYWSGLANRYKAYFGISPNLIVKLSPNPWVVSPRNPDPSPVP